MITKYFKKLERKLEDYNHIKIFPHHKHIVTGAVVESNEPDIEEILIEIENHISD